MYCTVLHNGMYVDRSDSITPAPRDCGRKDKQSENSKAH